MKTKNRIINLRKFKMKSDSFDRCFVLKRDLTLREARYILKNLLGIVICEKADCFDLDEYKDYNEGLLKDVTGWLKGDVDDETLMLDYAGDCGDEPVGIWNAFKIAEYLQHKDII